MNLLITGGAGFIGSNLAEELVRMDHSVTILDRLKKPNKISSIIEQCSYLCCDIRNRKMVEDLFLNNSFEGIIHLASISRVVWGEQKPTECIDVNVNGTKTILETAQKSKIPPWIIFGSSREVYGEPDKLPVSETFPLKPINIYGKTKLEGENLVRWYSNKTGSKGIIMRFSNVYGNEKDILERVIPKFIIKALKGERIEIHGGKQIFDFTYIDDTVEGIIRTMNYIKENEEPSVEDFNILTGKGTTLQEVVEIISKSIGYNLNVIYTSPRNYDVEKFTGSPQKAKKILGFRAKTLSDSGIPKTVELYREVFGV